MAGRRGDPRLREVEFLCNDDAEWALFWVERPDYGRIRSEQLYARKVSRNRITFGRPHVNAGEGSSYTPSPAGERTFPISVLRRVIDDGIPAVRGGRFEDKTREFVTYVTTCGETRTVRLDVLRQVVEDAEALP